MGLDGKVAWITGAGTGIGLAGAQALAQAGAVVVMSGRRAEVLEREAGQIRQAGAKAEIEPLDVSDHEQVARVAADILRRHGRVDILVNSAGLNVTDRYWRNQTLEGWDEVIGANLDGSFYTTFAVLPAMRKQRDGLVINVSSWAGVYHAQLTGAAYNASKHAVVAMTETINMEECVNGIRACAICPRRSPRPSWIAGRFHPAPRIERACCARRMSATRSVLSPSCPRTPVSTRSSSARPGTGSTPAAWRRRRPEAGISPSM